MQPSLFHIYSIGRAAVNKKRSSVTLEILPIEKMSYVDGEIVDNIDETEIEGEDAFGIKYKDKVQTSNTIEASWLPFGSNRRTPPDIRRGERVLIWRYGDADAFYWTTTGLDDYLRRLETVIWCFSNTKDESVKQLTPENSWYFEVSTHDKTITLKTNTSDGEAVSYAMQFDINKGLFVLQDDLGNYIKLDSFNKLIVLKNSDESILALNKTAIEGSSKESISFKTKNYSLQSEVSAVNSKTMTFKGTSLGITAQTSVTGKTSIAGNTNIQGNTAVTGNLTNNGTNVGNTHTHIGVHGQTSSPV